MPYPTGADLFDEFGRADDGASLASPWPLKYLVSEWMVRSAPRSSGLSEMQVERDPRRLLDRIACAAVSEIPNATYAGLSLFTSTGVETHAATHELVAAVDAAQYETDEGPCLSASREGRTVRENDLRTEQRWPRFATRAVELGVCSMLSVQLFVEGDAMGALNLYSAHADAFDDEDENVGLVLGSHAAVAMAASRMRTNFDIALSSRDLIGQAKGILMERYKVGPQQAFEMLVWASQHAHVKLRDIAQALAETGEFDLR